MGGSHAVGRALEPLYRAHGIDAIALPLSEQLGQPLVDLGQDDPRHVAVRGKCGGIALVRRDQRRDWRHLRADPRGGIPFSPAARLSLVGVGGTEKGIRSHAQPDDQLCPAPVDPRRPWRRPVIGTAGDRRPQRARTTPALAGPGRSVCCRGHLWPPTSGTGRGDRARSDRAVPAALLLARRRAVAAWADGNARPVRSASSCFAPRMPPPVSSAPWRFRRRKPARLLSSSMPPARHRSPA